MTKSFPAKKSSIPSALSEVTNTLASQASSVSNDQKEVVKVDESDAPPTVLEVAQSLQSHTTFSAFVAEGHGATLLLSNENGGTIFGYFAKEMGNFAQVVETDNPELRKDDFVHLTEVRDLAEKGMKNYFPKIGKDPVIENVRAEMLNMILMAISDEGGHIAVEHAMKRACMEKQVAEETHARAMRISNDIKNGKLISDPFQMFVGISKAKLFGFYASDRPIVLQSGYLGTDGKKNLPVFGVSLLSSPFNTGVPEGTFLPLARLFDNTHMLLEVAAMAKMVQSLFGESLDKAMRLVEELAIIEGRASTKVNDSPSSVIEVASQEPASIATTDESADVSTTDVVNYFKLGNGLDQREQLLH